MRTAVHRCCLQLAALLCFSTSGSAMPTEVRHDLQRPHIVRIDRSVAKLPQELKESLRRVFKQRKLSIADPGKPFRDTDFIVTAAMAKLPARRLSLAFSTPRFYYVYYRSGGYGTAGNLLAFSRGDGAYKFVWGGVEFADEPSTPQEVSKRVRQNSFDDSKKFEW
jgi:hypothetical protein